jgi:hypothetical protein
MTVAGFEPGPAHAEPFRAPMSLVPQLDPHDVLPPGSPREKWTRFYQRKVDAYAGTPAFAEIRELADDILRRQADIANRIKPKADGGFGLPEHAVVIERRALERVEAELARVTALKTDRGARANVVARLEHSIRDWLRSGIPQNCRIESIDDPPVGELLRKNETPKAAMARFGHRLRELAADRHRMRSAAWPSSPEKEKFKAEILARADAAAPDVERAIEFGLPVRFATAITRAMVTGAPGAVVTTEDIDFFGLICWLLKDEMLSKINAAFDETADDKHALSRAQREQVEAQIAGDELEIHRRICAVVWHADAEGEIIDFPENTPPQALLGLQLVQETRAEARGTSPEHVITFAGVR